MLSVLPLWRCFKPLSMPRVVSAPHRPAPLRGPLNQVSHSMLVKNASRGTEVASLC